MRYIVAGYVVILGLLFLYAVQIVWRRRRLARAVARVVAEALDPAATTLGAVMTPRPDTLKPHASAIEALRMMQDGGYRHLPLVDGERIAGIVSRGDFCGLEQARLDDETGFWEIL